MTDLKPLGGITLAQGQVCREPVADAYLAGLRSACAEDQAIWDIYPVSMTGEHFSASVTKMLAPSSRLVYAIIDADAERVMA